MTIKCERCTEQVNQVDICTVLGEKICIGCLDKALNNGDIYRCPICEEYHVDGYEVQVSETSTRTMCYNCVRTNIDDGGLHECDYCGDIVSEDNYIHIEELNTGVCKSCYSDRYTRCQNCEEHRRRSDVYYDDCDNVYCGDCFHELYRDCNRCGSTVDINDIIYDDNRERYYCPSCYKVVQQNIIRDYHTMKSNNRYTFLRTEQDKKKPLFFGLELEVDTEKDINPNEGAIIVNEILNGEERMVTFEHDGSLNRGFEMIWQPMTLEYLKSKSDLFKMAFKELQHNGYTSHDNKTCGLHIHFNRDYFGSVENQIRVEDNLLFLSEIFKTELQAFCRRSNNSYANFLSDTNYNPTSMKKLTNIKKAHKMERYQVFNLTNNNTIEFRLPKGTLRFDTLLATVEFLDNFIYFANKSESELLCLTWNDIMTRNKTKNKELIEYGMYRRILSSDTIINFGAVDTIGQLTGKDLEKVMKKAEKKGARMDLTLGVGDSNIHPAEYTDRIPLRPIEYH